MWGHILLDNIYSICSPINPILWNAVEIHINEIWHAQKHVSNNNRHIYKSQIKIINYTTIII